MAREVNMTVHQVYDMVKREMNIVRESIRRIENQLELTNDDELELDRLYHWNEFLFCSLSLPTREVLKVRSGKKMGITEAVEYTQVLIDRTQAELIKAIFTNSLDVDRLKKEFNYYLLVQELLEDLYR